MIRGAVVRLEDEDDMRVEGKGKANDRANPGTQLRL